MATLTSSVPAVIDELVAALNDRTDLGTDATGKKARAFGEMQGDSGPLQSIQFFGCDEDQAFKTIGGRVREETFTLLGGIFIELPGASPEAAKKARHRAYELLACLEKTLRADPHLAANLTAGGYQLLRAELKSARLEQYIVPNGRIAALEIHVGCVARLTTDPADL